MKWALCHVMFFNVKCYVIWSNLILSCYMLCYVVISYHVMLNQILHYHFFLFQVKRRGKFCYHIHGDNTATSSYTRFLNSPVRHSDINTINLFCYGKAHYITTKDIYPGQELLVHYRDFFTRYHLGIALEDFYNN